MERYSWVGEKYVISHRSCVPIYTISFSMTFWGKAVFHHPQESRPLSTPCSSDITRRKSLSQRPPFPLRRNHNCGFFGQAWPELLDQRAGLDGIERLRWSQSGKASADEGSTKFIQDIQEMIAVQINDFTQIPWDCLLRFWRTIMSILIFLKRQGCQSTI
jgi:hypothetical protein